MDATFVLKSRGRRLMQLGFVLFLLGLLTGFLVPVMANPRMGLASHLEGVMNGIFLVALGLAYPHLRIGMKASRAILWLVVYGTYTNWITTLIAAYWWAGKMMPLANGKDSGVPWQEGIIAFGLISLSFAMIVAVGWVVWGLRGPAGDEASPDMA